MIYIRRNIGKGGEVEPGSAARPQGLARDPSQVVQAGSVRSYSKCGFCFLEVYQAIAIL